MVIDHVSDALYEVVGRDGHVHSVADVGAGWYRVSRLTSPQRLVRRARIVLLASEEWPNIKIAAAWPR